MKLIKIVSNICKNPYLLVECLGRKGYLNWLSDDIYIKLLYKSSMKKSLDLNNPVTFNEKIQWLKINDRNPLYTKLADKYEVREYIQEQIGNEYLIPLIGVYNDFEEIDFDTMPKQFVLKTTHDSGGVVICKDKSKFDIALAKDKINKCLNRNYYYNGREYQYKNIKPRIICEKYLECKDSSDLRDYKLMCFNGEVKLILVCSERAEGKDTKMDFYDSKWNKVDCKRPNKPTSSDILKRPIYLDKMIDIARHLSREHIFIRVDFYEVNKKLYFGELTLHPASGFTTFEPSYYDDLLGSWINIS